MVRVMTADRMITPAAVGDPGEAKSGWMTATDYDALVRELDSLRARHRTEVAERLRLAREFGDGAGNDDLLAVLEDVAIDGARIAQLEELVRCASVVEEGVAGDGGAGLGSVVRVADDAGRTTAYRLIGRRSPAAGTHEVSLASPVGARLLGARAGDVIHVELPGGRCRTLRVLEVTGGVVMDRSGAAKAA